MVIYRYIINDIPPSNNKYLGNDNSRHIYAKKKKEWEWIVFITIGKNKPKQPLKRTIVKITYYFKDKRRRDPDNYSGKFILDGLVKAGVILDDSFKHIQLILEGKCDKYDPRTEIIVQEIEGGSNERTL